MRTTVVINGREYWNYTGTLRKQRPARKRATRSVEPAPHPSQKWLTRAQAAALLSMTEEQIRGLVRHGHLVEGEHFFKPSPRILRFDRSALERWLTKRRSTQPVEPQLDLSDDKLRALVDARAKQLKKKELAR